MKHIVFSVLGLLLTSGAFAASQVVEPPVATPQAVQPRVTEIRLTDNPGFVRAPRAIGQFTFRADDTLEWLGGNDAAPSRLLVSLRKGDFQKLVMSLEDQKFYDLEPTYPKGPRISDVASFTISVTRDGEKKQVRYMRVPRPNGEPLNLWITEKLLRGVAWEAIHKQSPQPAK